MMRSNNNIFKSLILILILCFGCVSLVMARPDPIDPPPTWGTNPTGPEKTPQPATVDRITHNVGNVVTTIDNWGYIGGYSYYGLPSGQFPRNSGHDYLAEIKYWMGATIGNDTICANSYDDFEALPSEINGTDEYSILLSTDTTRYSYDLADTVGAATGRPANGWRVWDGNLSDWIYNNSYYPLSASFVESGPTSLQESHYRFHDNADGNSLGLEVTQTIMQWNYCYNEDIMFVVLDITNTSANHYSDFAFGLYVDLDVGGPDGSGENGRLGDLVGYDQAENLSWTYDEDNYDPGWGRLVTAGVMGTKYLETPDGIGMTAFRTGDWAQVTSVSDSGRYEMIASNQYDASLPPTDQYYLQCTSGIDMTAGKTVRVVFALLAGTDMDDFQENAQMAQQLYDAYFVGPEPPQAPTLKVRAGDETAYLRWNDTAEVSLDPLSSTADFIGYKLYRSDNQGKTWGRVIHNTGNDCLTQDYETVATYVVDSAGLPIAHSYTDTGLFNGVEYWYCLAAFDKGDEVVGVDALQTGFGIAGEAGNVVSVMPKSSAAGYYESAATVEHNYSGNGIESDGTIMPILFDASLTNGSEYQVVFEDQPDATVWHLLNVTTGDTVLANQTRIGGDANMFEVAEGIRVVVEDGELESRGYSQTTSISGSTTMEVDVWIGPALPDLFADDSYVYGHQPYRSNYEFRYTGDSTYAEWYLNWYYGDSYGAWVPFEVWNITTNQRVALAHDDLNYDDLWTPGEPLVIVDYEYAGAVPAGPFPLIYNWAWEFNFVDSTFNPQTGDVFTVQGAPLNGPDDDFTFSLGGIDAAVATNNMAKIRVVPNPYFVSYSPMVETSVGSSVIEFQEIPESCTIRVYNLSGDLVTTIDHNDGTGVARWNLLSSEGRQVASGVYLFHVESDYGDHLGRFAIVK